MVNHQRIRILLVEDEPAYATILGEVLAASGSSPFELGHAACLAAASALLTARPFDVVLLDLSLPDRQGLATYTDLHALAPAMPFIVLTGFDDEQLALQAVRDGAQDYLVKGQFDSKMLTRVIRYAIERKRSEEAVRQSEEFFRLISENVNDLIAVIDKDGRRLYNSPSYKRLLGEPNLLIGTDSFEEIHPADRQAVKQLFRETVQTGQGHRAEYRMQLEDGTVRHIESQGSVIRDGSGAVSKVVVVSRDITERMEAVAVLRHALADLKKSHEDLKAAQLQLIQAEKLEAVSTFAAGVAHEVKNPLQTVILGVDYLANHVSSQDATAAMVLEDMSGAVMRADGIIRGLLEFSATKRRDVREQDLTAIVEQSLRAVEGDLVNYPIRLIKDLRTGLPLLRFDAKTMKHVFINLFMHAIREMPQGGKLAIRTFVRVLEEDFRLEGRASALFKKGETIVGAAVEEGIAILPADDGSDGASTIVTAWPVTKESGLGLTVLKKIIELYGGVIDVTNNREKGNHYTVMFNAQGKE